MEIVKKILLVMTSGIIGACMMLFYTDKYGSDYQILYVAEDELMKLEHERIKGENIEFRQLFFGEIERAVSLAVNLPKAYQNKKTQVLYSTSSIKGEHVRSISKEIHRKIIQELQKEDKPRMQTQ